MRKILSADKANDLAQKANSGYMIASYIKTIQDKYFRLDEEELVQVLISNANRYITLALKILNLAGYDARRPYIFHRWSKIIVKLPEKGKIENV
ncbi:MAG: hypothetical protein N4S00_01805 [Lactobacillus crispatus]|nr:hypothetical protein [Lactobacillus crispatus]